MSISFSMLKVLAAVPVWVDYLGLFLFQSCLVDFLFYALPSIKSNGCNCFRQCFFMFNCRILQKLFRCHDGHGVFFEVLQRRPQMSNIMALFAH